MRPLCDARIEDLGPGDSLKVECIGCGHAVLISSIGLQQVPPYKPVLASESRFRCRECDARGKVVVSIQWAQ
jgi:hypothetical protein